MNTQANLLATSIQARIYAQNAEVCAMNAANAECIQNGTTPAYNAQAFYAVARELESLSNEAIDLSLQL